jgi:hypothetical protein
MGYFLGDPVDEIKVIALAITFVVGDDAFEPFVAGLPVKIVAVGVDYNCGALDVLASPVG